MFPLKKLAFDQVLTYLSGFTQTSDGRSECLEITPLTDQDEIRLLHKRVDALQKMLQEGIFLDFNYSGSVKEAFEFLSVEGISLDRGTLFDLHKWLQMAGELRRTLESAKENLPELASLEQVQLPAKDLQVMIGNIFTSRGEIKDTASDELRRIRRAQQSLSGEIRKDLTSMLKNARKQGWTDAREVVMRNDRLVIPLNADFKGNFPGFVQDVSQSGNTVFLEPAAILEKNNRSRALQMQEKNEINKILLVASNRLREVLPELIELDEWLIGLDVLYARAKMGEKIEGTCPQISDKRVHELKEAYHPLLLIKSGRKKVVPLSIIFTNDQRIVLISGPNAGGKSVCLKTVGLLQLMVQAGLPVPCDPESVFSVYEKMFVDLGDEQSLQSDLSTYTSHLSNMKAMLDGLDGRSLFLIDEFGTGTDPRLGGAIAEAFLEFFVKSNARGVITTHYGNLKHYADKGKGMANASMEFDPGTLKPTYRLQVGRPGRSYAMEIASNVGVPGTVINLARKKLDGAEVKMEELILKLETQEAKLNKLVEENQGLKGRLKFLLEENETVRDNLEIRKEKILQNAEEEAKRLIFNANKEIERTIREIREKQAEKEATKKLRKELKAVVPAREKKSGKTQKAPKQKAGDIKPIEVGCRALIRGSETEGTVSEVKGNQVILVVGAVKMKVKKDQLVRVANDTGAKKKFYPKSKAVDEIPTFSPELNVMGMRVEEAFPVVTKFIDQAMLYDAKKLRILHGKGTGALREGIRNYLRQFPEVKKMEDEDIRLGGAGWTVVWLEE